MKKNYILRLPGTLLCLLLAHFLLAQAAAEHEVFILGNLTHARDQVLLRSQLEKLFNSTKSPFTLVLNGDFVDRKIGDNDNRDQLEVIYRLADLVQTFPNGNLLIVPGDQEWNASRRGGEKSLENIEERVQDYIADHRLDRCRWAVENGCPGPETFEVSDGLVILAMNTQWWNHPYDKPRPTDATCDGLSEENLKEGLEDAVEEHQDRNVLIVGHHPVRSLGNFGGHFSVREHLLPFPGMQEFPIAFHTNVGSRSDLANERLDVYIDQLKNLLYFHDNLIYASGHEHNQQVLAQGGNYLVNSGAPTRPRYAAKDNTTLFSEQMPGLMGLRYFADGRVEAVFYENIITKQAQAGEANFKAHEPIPLFASACGETPRVELPVNTNYVPCKSTVEPTQRMARKYDEIATIAAGPEYVANGWKRIWFGQHYRPSWAQPVKVGYLDLDETFGGLTIYEKGGGRQTTSLKFLAGDGSAYTFRSVNKDPSKALNYRIRNTFAADVVRDQTSTQQPYGAMVVAPLLEKIGILHATPKLYLLPDDPKLGPFQKKYGGLFGMLEENPSKRNNEGEHFAHADRIDKSLKMFKRFYRDQDTEMDTDEFLRARLFDIWVGDWSKHEDNWKWAGYKIPGGYRYRPIPRDRDHVFSRQDGFFNWLADRSFGLPNIENFGYDYTGLRSLTDQAKHMDRFLLAEVPKTTFLAEAKFIQENITDADIEAAVRHMPPEIYNLSGHIIEAKLKKRLRHLPEAMEEYYKLLNREVDVVGSKDEEYFEVEYLADGRVHVQMFDTHGDLRGTKLLFDRTFLPSETKEVRLWGLADDDIFHITGSSKGQILVRTFGGPGDDVFRDEATAARTLLYDKGESTTYKINGQAKVVNHWNRELYEYDRTRFSHNSFLPIIFLGYTNYTGFGINLGGNWTVRKFGKDDYHSKHSVGGGLTTESNFSASYSGRFHHVLRRWDFTLDAFMADPGLQNRFYGQGNGSVNMDNELGRRFYQTAVNTRHASIGLARDFWQKSSVGLRVGLEQNESENILGTFLSQNSEDIFAAEGRLTTLPIGLSLDLDFRDKKGLPYRGARAVLNYDSYMLLTNDVAGGTNYGVASLHLEHYFSTKQRHPITLGLRFGGATSHGQVPWYHLPTIGTNHGLRGFVENRFAGESSAFFNAELRYQFLEKETSFLPMKAGVKVFYDHGRVFLSGWDENKGFRSGYGFGVYLVPLHENFTLSLSLGFSDEETVYPVFSVGTPLR